MIRNYFKTAWRNLWKNKMATGINLFGLITGMTCCILMILYIRHELSHDRFQEKGDRIVRVIMAYKIGEAEWRQGNFTSTKVLPSFQKNFPEVEGGVRMSRSQALVKSGTEIYTEPRFLFADSSFFEVFPSFTLLKGTSTDALNAPNKVVLSVSTAKKYFGEQDPVGQTIQVGASQKDYLVSGVAADSPVNSQIKFDFLASFSSLGPAQEETYFNANYTTYLLLRDEASIGSLQAKIGPFMEKEMAAHTGVSLTYELEPYNRIHLHSPYGGFEPTGNMTYLYIAGGVALLILLIACFTFINLSTARSMERAKEVGVRKVTGASRGQVFWQFISESALLAFISMVISLLLSSLLISQFGNLVDREISLDLLFDPIIMLNIIALTMMIALLAGAYPAIVLSAFRSIKVLKGTFHSSVSGTRLKQGLFIFQFVISVFLIIATFIMQSQLHYTQQKKLGYDREHAIVLPIDQKIFSKGDLLKSEWKQHPGILATSFAYETPVQIRGGYSMYSGHMTPDQAMAVTANPIDEEYLTACGIELIAGEDLSRQDILDISHEDYTQNYFHFIINESAARALGWTPGEAIGQKLFLDAQRPGEVKGVVRDFHFSSLHDPIAPLVLFPGNWHNQLIIKTTGQQIAETLTFIEQKWKEIAPHRPFSYTFMDDAYRDLYTAELRIGRMMNLFAGITILLACLGLFGLSSYTVQQKRKEIGIRKVLGASVTGIVSMLSRNFIGMVVLSILIAAPLAWWVMTNWLQDFTYRIDIQWWMFALTGFGAVLIALLTVSWRTIQAATSNPVDSLKDE